MSASKLSALASGEAGEVSDLVVVAATSCIITSLASGEAGVILDLVVQSSPRTPNEVEVSEVELAARAQQVSESLMSACEELWMLPKEVEV